MLANTDTIRQLAMLVLLANLLIFRNLPKNNWSSLFRCSRGKRLREVRGSVVSEELEPPGRDRSSLLTVLVLAAVGTSLLCGYKKFWEKCRGDY